ncbi:MAG: zinc-dependent metalloprotease [Candidatus Riflebacteria bacterium]|nr:zinc-dependent metalloprotease [Candidatus Riflebacteria bacterium]
MKTIAGVLLALLVTAGSASQALAGQLMTLNPRLRDAGFQVSSYVKKPVFTTLSVTKDFLDKTYLFGALAEASTDNYLTMGEGAGPYRIRWEVEGNSALMLLDQRELVPAIGGSSQLAINRFPMREVGDEVELDLAHPEVKGFGLVVDGTAYKGERPGAIYDLVSEPGFVSWGEKFLCQAEGETDGPAQLTLAVKYFLKEAGAPTAYQAKLYSDDDARRYGFFTMSKLARQEDGTAAEQTFVTRWDLSRKVVYLLHPSIPAAYRQTFRDCVLSWNKVFLQTNGVEPIEVRDGTDDQLPGDLRNHVLYWVDYPTPYGNGAIGPSLADPDTGEMLDGDVIFYAASYRDTIARLRYEAANDPKAKGRCRGSVKQALEGRKGRGKNPKQNRGFELKLGPAGGLTFRASCACPFNAAAKLTAKAQLDVTTMTDEELFKRLIQETIPHEVGHTLGLRHNFSGTADVKNAKGADSTSLMDYEVDLQALIEPGSYDTAAIAFGYDGKAALHENQSFLYATDEDLEVDPLANQWDSGDVLAFYEARYKHFLKLRDGDYFTSFQEYAGSQESNLQVLRKFVNRDEKQGRKAFDFLVKILLSRPPEPPFNAVERLLAMQVLTTPSESLAPLDDKQLSAVAEALAQNVAPCSDDDFDFRVAAIETLKQMNNIYGYQALQTVAAAFKKARTGKAGPLEPRDQELVLRIEQALPGYFAK